MAEAKMKVLDGLHNQVNQRISGMLAHKFGEEGC